MQHLYVSYSLRIWDSGAQMWDLAFYQAASQLLNSPSNQSVAAEQNQKSQLWIKKKKKVEQNTFSSTGFNYKRASELEKKIIFSPNIGKLTFRIVLGKNKASSWMRSKCTQPAFFSIPTIFGRTNGSSALMAQYNLVVRGRDPNWENI